ncbi:TonB-dependent receptor [Stenotrophomonas sp. YIM B06876]|uniref:TonB-dependent receptor n=1 Tax=Stenotrophomonas sp. YIM B06876 TaxID=3060211 RepID=UPI002739B646|nr:TonB-dependent receptor [Stenotrophomonas sp. YIM B06876]
MNLKSTRLRDAITLALLSGVAVTGTAFAQDSSSKGEPSTTLDRIEVTGSRLKRAEIEGAQPVTVIDRVQIDASGETSVADYLRTTNFNSVGQFRPQSGSSAQAGAFADLRGLGGQRTLVLIDGHRAPKAPFAAGSGTDLNTIPLAAVERIEVLTDGASAIYGADAVGGVINIITRKDFEGAQVMLGKSDPKWGRTDEGSILFGASGDRGRMIGGFSHNRRAMIFTNSRPWGQTLGVSTYGNNYRSFDPVTGKELVATTALPGGCTNENFYLLPNGRCSYNFNKVAADEAATRNNSFFMNGEVQVDENWSVYANTSVSNTTSFGRYAPTPGAVAIAPDAAQNPVPGALTYLYHRFAAAGNRDNTTDGTVYDVLLGTRGAVSDSIDFDGGVRYNTYRYKELGRNYIVASLAEQAINDDLYNIYNPAATPEDVLNSIKATISRDSVFTTKEAFANLTFNDLFQMGGGSASLAVGAEFRKEQFDDVYDSLSSAGVVLGSSGASAGDSRKVTAAYFEMLFPITSTFDANLAGRYEKYSDYGNNFAPKLSLRWHPIDSLTLRGSVGKGFVAPTLDVISQATAFSADSVYDPASCLDQGAGTAAKCAAFANKTDLQVDSYREKAEGLGAEKSTQYQVGGVWDATSWLNVTLDYWNIQIKDRIAFFSSQKLIDIELGRDPTPFPGAPCSIIRDKALANSLGSPIKEIHNCYFNQGKVKTDGVDLTLRTNFDLGNWGSLANMMQASYQRSYTIDGGENQAGLQGFPHTRATLNNTWSRGDWSAVYNVRYIGSNGSNTDGDYTKAYVTHDVQLSLAMPWNAKVMLGVNNLTNKLPELIAYDGRPFNFYLYDAYGRSPYVRYEQRF